MFGALPDHDCRAERRTQLDHTHVVDSNPWQLTG